MRKTTRYIVLRFNVENHDRCSIKCINFFSPFASSTRKKGDRQRTMNELDKKGLMPSKMFDYKMVDFSDFQGGSANAPNQVNFEQTMVRDC